MNPSPDTHITSRIVRMQFALLPMTGEARLPTDYGEALFAGLSRINRHIHENPDVRISPIVGGVAAGSRLLLNRNFPGGVILQTPVNAIPELLIIAGRTLDVAGNKLRIGIPQIRPLVPSKTIISRMITVKGKNSEEELREFLQRELLHRYSAEAGVDYNLHILRRRVISVHGKRIHGYGLAITDIASEHLSLTLQAFPPASARGKYGCGFLHPGTYNLNKHADDISDSVTAV
jgi:CRISPR-associated protein Cas6